MAHPGRPRGRMNKKTLQAQAASQAEELARVQQQQAQRAAQAQMGNNPHQQAQSIKEEAGVQLHDEADLISFRNDALLRYITNHEYIENVMSKLIHSSKIIPPSLYPLLAKINDYENLKPEDVYFGDLEAMKYVENKLAEKLNQMNQESDPSYVRYLFSDEKYKYQREKMAELSELQNNLHDKDSLTNLESELDNMLKEYKTKFNQEYTKKSAVSQYSISIDKISSHIEVTSAPENYNPKLITSFINMNNSTTNDSQNNMNSENSSAANFNNEGLNGFQFNGNIDTSKFNGFSGIPMNQFDNNFGLSMNNSQNYSSNNENNSNINTGSSIPPHGINSNEDININTNNSESNMNTGTSNIDLNSESESSNSNSNSNSNINTNAADEDEDDVMVDISTGQDQVGQTQENQQKSQDNTNEGNDDSNGNNGDSNENNNHDTNSNDLDMNDFFNDKGDEDLGGHLAMVDDDIGDLYNFETGGDDDNGLIGGSEFELDFLSHIDHGME